MMKTTKILVEMLVTADHDVDQTEMVRDAILTSNFAEKLVDADVLVTSVHVGMVANDQRAMVLSTHEISLVQEAIHGRAANLSEIAQARTREGELFTANTIRIVADRFLVLQESFTNAIKAVRR